MLGPPAEGPEGAWAGGVGGGGGAWVGWGEGNPLWVYLLLVYRILDIYFVNIMNYQYH